ncbi:MAG TPA: N-acetylneuraminate synthase family protein [Vicinamibacterales bacterium]
MSADRTLTWSGDGIVSIAEIGLNHGGSVGRALEMVDAAARAGATAIKLQSVVAEKLVSAAASLEHVGATSLGEFFRGLELAWEAHGAIVARAHARGVFALTTPFAVDAVPVLAALGFDGFKVASGDLTYTDLIGAVAATGRPVVLSSGMSTVDEVATALEVARAAGGRELAILHCVSAYPTPVADENLRAITTLRAACDVPVGLSDHGRGLASAIAAVALGARVYERHFVLAGDDTAVDRAVSSTPDELATIVTAMETTRVALGDGRKTCRPAERANRRASRRGLYAARALAAGDVVTPGDIAVLRPSTALSPSDVHLLVGQVLAKPVAAGEAFSEMEGKRT